MYNTSYNCEYQKASLGQRDFGSSNQNPEYYYAPSPDYEYGRINNDKYMNPIPSVITPKIQETNIFNFDFPNLELREINDKNQKKNENNQNIINQKDKEPEKEEKSDEKENCENKENKENKEIDEEEMEAIIIKEEDLDLNKLLKLTNCDKPILSKKLANNNIIKENPNYKPKFIVIKNDGSNINSKLMKKRKLRKRYKMRGYYKITKNFKKKKICKILNKIKKEKKETDNFINNNNKEINYNTQKLFQNENIINSQQINRNFNYINNDYNNYNNNIINNNMNNINNNNSFNYYQKQQLPLRTNLINTKIIYKEDPLNNLDYKGNMGFYNQNEYKVKENISNLANIKKMENEDNTYTGTLNSSAIFIPQIFESKSSGTIIDGIEYATLLVPKNYVEKIKQIIAEE